MAITKKAGGGLHDRPERRLQITSNSAVKQLEAFHHDLLSQYHDLAAFSKDVQHDPDHVASTYRQLANDESPFAAFLRYLASPEGNLLQLPIHEDLTLPLSNYFISSSHNTYLTGNQLSSDSSADGYRDVLLRGCRCVEIDVWDGKEEDETQQQQAEKPKDRSLKTRILGRFKSKRQSRGADLTTSSKEHASSTQQPKLPKKGEPRVLHGYTMTKEISFREVCEAIRDNAFVNSDLPVIVSLEVHANLEQQAVMVEIITNIWGELLINLPNATSADVDPLPPPSQLKKKILIKVKYTSPEKVKQKHKEEENAEKHRHQHQLHHQNPHPPEQRPRNTSDLSTSSEEDSTQPEQKKPKKKKMLDSLSGLGIYTRSHHFKSFDQPEAELPSHVFSLSEGAVSEAHETNAKDLFKHNQRYFMRTYPRGTRINSSNLNPALFWRQGIQIVALNWQKTDKGVMLNEAMFAGTGGWVLKPESYRSSAITRQSSPNLMPSAHEEAKLPSPSGRPPKMFDIDIQFLAAQDIPLPPDTSVTSFRPYIKCTLHTETLKSSATPSRARGSLRRRSSSRTDRKVDKASKLKQTTVSAQSKTTLKGRTQTQRGCSPDLEGELIKFRDVPVDEESLSFLRFKIEDDIELRPDEMAAWACYRLDKVNEGLRTVQLFDRDGKLSKGFLLVKVTKTAREDQNDGASTALPMR